MSKLVILAISLLMGGNLALKLQEMSPTIEEAPADDHGSIQEVAAEDSESQVAADAMIAEVTHDADVNDQQVDVDENLQPHTPARTVDVNTLHVAKDPEAPPEIVDGYVIEAPRKEYVLEGDVTPGLPLEVTAGEGMQPDLGLPEGMAAAGTQAPAVIYSMSDEEAQAQDEAEKQSKKAIDDHHTAMDPVAAPVEEASRTMVQKIRAASRKSEQAAGDALEKMPTQDWVKLSVIGDNIVKLFTEGLIPAVRNRRKVEEELTEQEAHLAKVKHEEVAHHEQQERSDAIEAQVKAQADADRADVQKRIEGDASWSAAYRAGKRAEYEAKQERMAQLEREYQDRDRARQAGINNAKANNDKYSGAGVDNPGDLSGDYGDLADADMPEVFQSEDARNVGWGGQQVEKLEARAEKLSAQEAEEEARIRWEATSTTLPPCTDEQAEDDSDADDCALTEAQGAKIWDKKQSREDSKMDTANGLGKLAR